jgi:hypothetical protein
MPGRPGRKGVGGKGIHHFVSKAQQRWAFATHKKFARKDAVRDPRFKTLPERKGARKKP